MYSLDPRVGKTEISEYRRGYCRNFTDVWEMQPTGNYPEICDNVMLNNIITFSPSMEKRLFVLIQERSTRTKSVA